MIPQNQVTEFKNCLQNNKQEFIKARTLYLKALAIHETTLKIDKESSIKVLKNNEFKNTEDNTIIRKPESDYLMNDEDFTEYLKLKHQERNNRGLRIPNAETTSDYKTFKLLNWARKQFIEVALKSFPKKLSKELNKLKERYIYKITEKFIDLCLKVNLKEEVGIKEWLRELS